MAESYKGYVIQQKHVPPQIGSAGSAFRTVFVASRDGQRWKQFQTLTQAKQAIDLEVAREDEHAQMG